MKTKQLLLLALMIPGMALAASGNEQQDKPASTPAIELWADLGLGLISEEDAKAKMEPQKGNLKSALESEIKELTGHLYGVRNVKGKQMSDIVAKIDQVTSFSSTSAIGMTKESAYLEVIFFLTSGRSYVVVVSAPLSDCPPATLDKLKQLLDAKK